MSRGRSKKRKEQAAIDRKNEEDRQAKLLDKFRKHSEAPQKEVLTVTEPEEVLVPTEKEKRRAQAAARTEKLLAGRITIDGYTVQPDLGCPHGSNTAFSNWGCRCPLCGLANHLWKIDDARGIAAGLRRGSPNFKVMVDPELLTPNLLAFYDKYDRKKVPHAVKELIEARKKEEISKTNGHHEEAEIVKDTVQLMLPEIPDEPPQKEPPPPPPIHEDDVTIISHDQKTVTYSDGSTVTRKNNQSIIFTSAEGNAVMATLPSVVII